MRGISEESLKKLWDSFYVTEELVGDFEERMMRQCEELNDWKPIDKNTPENRHVLLLTEDNIVIDGYFVDLDGGCWVDGLNHDEIKPKAWQELPPLPKEQP